MCSGVFLGGPAAKDLPSNAGDTGPIPGWGMKSPHAVGQLSPRATLERSPRATTEESPCMPQADAILPKIDKHLKK